MPFVVEDIVAVQIEGFCRSVFVITAVEVKPFVDRVFPQNTASDTGYSSIFRQTGVEFGHIPIGDSVEVIVCEEGVLRMSVYYWILGSRDTHL